MGMVWNRLYQSSTNEIQQILSVYKVGQKTDKEGKPLPGEQEKWENRLDEFLKEADASERKGKTKISYTELVLELAVALRPGGCPPDEQQWRGGKPNIIVFSFGLSLRTQ